MERPIPVLLFLSVFVSLSQSTPRKCWAYNLDYCPCPHDSMSSLDNEYSVQYHAETELELNGANWVCKVVHTDEEYPISKLGTDEMRIITSPGFKLEENYSNNRLVRYNIRCEADELAFFDIISFQLQNTMCTYEGKTSCRDYIQIEVPGYGSTEKMCGFVPPKDFEQQLGLGTFTVVFRTSHKKTFKGFEIYIVCMKTSDIPQPNDGYLGEAMNSGRRRRSIHQNVTQVESLHDCIDVSEYSSGACAEGGRGTTQPPPLPPRRRKSCGKIATFYSELFPDGGYPPDLRIRADLATFHQPWSRFIGIPGLVTELDVFYNHTVNYTRDRIIVMDLDGEILARHAVKVLWTFDSNGTIQKYVRHVKDNRNPHFHGAGLMRIVNRHAYFQLFVIDPRGIAPTEAEQKELLSMITPLLKSNESILLDFNYTGDSLDIEDILYFENGDRDAVLAALRSKASCNPVLKAQSRATLTYYNE